MKLSPDNIFGYRSPRRQIDIIYPFVLFFFFVRFRCPRSSRQCWWRSRSEHNGHLPSVSSRVLRYFTHSRRTAPAGLGCATTWKFMAKTQGRSSTIRFVYRNIFCLTAKYLQIFIHRRESPRNYFAILRKCKLMTDISGLGFSWRSLFLSLTLSKNH